MNVPLLAGNKAVKLDFSAGRDRDSQEGEVVGVAQLTEVMSNTQEVAQILGCDDVWCSAGTILVGHLERDGNAAAAIRQGPRKWKLKGGLIYDKMRVGDVCSSRRREECDSIRPQAAAAGSDQATAFSFRFY